jgi:hypothetical protein
MVHQSKNMNKKAAIPLLHRFISMFKAGESNPNPFALTL